MIIDSNKKINKAKFFLSGVRIWLIILLSLILFLIIVPPAVHAQLSPIDMKKDLGKMDPEKDIAPAIKIFIVLTLLSLAPTIIIMTTSFTRIIIVLSFLRHALGTQQIPPTPVLLSLAIFLTVLTMLPTLNNINNDALQPYLTEQITQMEAIKKSEVHMRSFMIKYTRKKDLELMLFAGKIPRPKTIDEVPTLILMPAFVLSELRTAFVMGFALFISFLVMDMIVASVLMSMGMFMLPPMMVSLPLKVLLFVMVDGWYLVVRSLIMSFK